MKRVALTIVLNGMNHLLHNHFAYRMLSMFDLWVIVEGPAKNGGSTGWCTNDSLDYAMKDGASVDGTNSFLYGLRNLHHHVRHACGVWGSKDEQVNAGMEIIKSVTRPDVESYLWQVDVDEQWTPAALQAAEEELEKEGGDCGCFHANYYVGPNLLAKGCWGEGNDPEDSVKNAYRRLWKWRWQRFVTHEPPILEQGNGKCVLLPQRFDHFAYWFDEDVRFKEKYYQQPGLFRKWKEMQQGWHFKEMTAPIASFIDGYWGTTKTVIMRSV